MKHKYVDLKFVDPRKYTYATYGATYAANYATYGATYAANYAATYGANCAANYATYGAYESLKESIEKTGFYSVFYILSLSLTSLE